MTTLSPALSTLRGCTRSCARLRRELQYDCAYLRSMRIRMTYQNINATAEKSANDAAT